LLRNTSKEGRNGFQDLTVSSGGWEENLVWEKGERKDPNKGWGSLVPVLCASNREEKKGRGKAQGKREKGGSIDIGKKEGKQK